MRLSKRTLQMGTSLLAAVLVGYFLFETVEGKRGLVAEKKLQAEVRAEQEKLTRLKNENDALDHRIHLMRPGSLDPDLLDEESRKTLNYSKPGEVVILSPESPAPPPP